MKQKNIYTKVIYLEDVKDNKQFFALSDRNGATLYNRQVKLHSGRTNPTIWILITSESSGKSYWKKRKTNVYIKSC